jgi:glycosyltransferase involved in cell wall biosynthesis
VIVDTCAFNPQIDPFPLTEFTGIKLSGCPIITYIGKINYYWQSKGLLELIEAAKDINEDFLLLFVANGKGLDDFKRLLKIKGLSEKSLFLNFFPPWEIPSIIKLSTCVVIPEREFPIQYHVPILPKEVMAVGRCMILGREIAFNQFYGDLIDKENVLLINPKDIPNFKATIEFVVCNPLEVEKIGIKAYETSIKTDNLNEFVKFTLEQYDSLLHNELRS